jgi:hypothetical protein
LKPLKVIFRRGKRENTGGDEPNWGTLYAHMEVSQYIYYILVKTLNYFLKREN